MSQIDRLTETAGAVSRKNQEILRDPSAYPVDDLILVHLHCEIQVPVLIEIGDPDRGRLVGQWYQETGAVTTPAVASQLDNRMLQYARDDQIHDTIPIEIDDRHGAGDGAGEVSAGRKEATAPIVEQD